VAQKTFRQAGTPPVPDGTPEEIRDTITWDVREPETRADVGVPFTLPALPQAPPNRLVVLGDSISHGFKSFAIADTHLSWPAIVARAAGFDGFRYPLYPGPADCPGLPFNLEAALRHLEDKVPGAALDVVRDLDLAFRLRSLMDDVEDYWERGDGARLIAASAAAGPLNHNLAAWGWDVRDALGRTPANLRQAVQDAPHRGDDLIAQIPSASGERSALLTLAGGGPDDTALALAARLGAEADPGIDTLVVALGANNILGTVLSFSVQWSGPDYQDLDKKSAYNAWTPTHFATEYDELVRQVDAIAARHVVFLTVPHVTIVPMVRGVGDKMPGSRYFARYTRPWITDDVFSPNRHPCLTGDQLRVLDFAVDCYNDHIVSRVRDGRSRGKDWRVVDLAGLLDGLAYRRYLIDDEARPAWWQPYVLPDPYLALSPQPDTRFFQSDRFGRNRGGLFALDGVHPTTIGYGLVAREVMAAMAGAGVQMAAAAPDFDRLIEDDSLICQPPTRISSVLELVGFANRSVDLYEALRHQPPV
jgi:lysophospholipase L1-like esterase